MSQYQDSDLHLVFSDLLDAIDANNRIYENIARDLGINERGGNLYNNDTDTEVAESSIATNEVVPLTYPILSSKNGVEQKDTAFTNAWANIWEREDLLGSYVLPKPIAQYMTGVTGFTATLPRDDAWYPTEEV